MSFGIFIERCEEQEGGEHAQRLIRELREGADYALVVISPVERTALVVQSMRRVASTGGIRYWVDARVSLSGGTLSQLLPDVVTELEDKPFFLNRSVCNETRIPVLTVPWVLDPAGANIGYVRSGLYGEDSVFVDGKGKNGVKAVIFVDSAKVRGEVDHIPMVVSAGNY